MRFSVIADVHFVFFKNTKILLAKRANTGYMDGWWSLPGGHVEDGEPTSLSLCREMHEELGLVLDPGQLLPLHIMHRKQSDIRISTFWGTHEVGLKPTNCEPDKCSKLGFFSGDKLPPQTVPYILFALLQIKDHSFYSEFGWDKIAQPYALAT